VIWLLACAPASDPGPKPAEDTGTPPACAAGELWDGAACVPERCGTDPWPTGLPDDAVYVDAAAPSGGDGGRAAPWARIGDALDAVGQDAVVAVAAGTYPEGLGLEGRVSGLDLRGRCPELVVVDASDAPPDRPGLWVDGGDVHTWSVAGLTVTGGGYGGAWVLAGSLTLTDVVLTGNEVVGVGVGGDRDTRLVASGLRVHDNLDQGRMGGGYAVYALEGATVELTDSELGPGVNGALIATGGATYTLDQVRIHDIVAADTEPGVGVSLEGGALTGTGLVIEDIGAVGLVARDAEVRLTDSRVSRVDDGEDEQWGLCLGVDGGSVALDRVTLDGCGAAGLQLWDVQGTLTDVDVDGVAAPIRLASGVGLDVLDADLVLRRVHFADAAGGAVWVSGGTLELDEVTIDGEAEADEIRRGLDLDQGALVRAAGVTIVGTSDVGVGVVDATLTVESLQVDTTIPGPSGGGVGVYVSGGRVEGGGLDVVDSRLAGLLVEEGGVAELSEVTLRNTDTTPELAFGRGLEVHAGGAVDLTESTLSANREVGVYVGGEGSSARLEQVTIDGTTVSSLYGSGFGVVAIDGGVVSLDSVVIQSSEGPGVYAAYGGVVDAFQCTLLGNAFAGAIAYDGGSVSLRTCDVSATRADATMGGGVGVFGSDVATLLLDDVNSRGAPIAALWVEGPGDWSVVGSDLVGDDGVELAGQVFHGNGLYAGGGAVVEVTDSTLRYSRVGVLLDGASAVFDGVGVEANVLDLRQQRCEVVPPGPVDPSWTVDLCPAFDELVLPLEFRSGIGSVVGK